MTRQVEVAADELEEMAYNSRAVITFGPTRGYLTLPDGRRYVARIAPVAPVARGPLDEERDPVKVPVQRPGSAA